jgi:hypothetical protein
MPHKLANFKPYKLTPKSRRIKAAADRIAKIGLPDEKINFIIGILDRSSISDTGIEAIARVYEAGYIDFSLFNALHVSTMWLFKDPEDVREQVRRRSRIPAAEFIDLLASRI